MAGSDDLHPLLRNINESIAALRKDVQQVYSELQRITGIIRRGFDDLRDAIHENIQAQAELKVMEHQMDVRAADAKLEAKNEQISEEQAELEEKLKQINKRYARRQEELDEKASERVRDLGSHIFALREDDFQTGIRDRLLDQAAPAFTRIEEHATVVGEDREEKVRTAAEATAESVSDFVGKQKNLINKIESYRHDPAAIRLDKLDDGDSTSNGDEIDTAVRRIQVPYYVVNYRNKDGQHQTTVAPSVLVSQAPANDWLNVSLTEIEEVRELLEDVDGVDPSAPTVSEQTVSADRIESAIRPMELSTTLMPSYSDALSESLSQHLSILKDGGGNEDGSGHSHSPQQSPPAEARQSRSNREPRRPQRTRANTSNVESGQDQPGRGGNRR